jgi:AcrR family transcriptional regulator
MPKDPRVRSVSEILGRPPPPAAGRERILAAAIDLFYVRGFQAVGLDNVIEQAGVTKTTFYKHFEGKHDLMVAAVLRRDAWETEAWEEAVTTLAGEEPRARLLGFFDVLDVWFNHPRFQGCVFINTASEFPNPNDPVHKAAAKNKRRGRDRFRDLAKAAGARDPEGFADRYVALVEGTLVLRQVHGKNDAARVIRPAVVQLIDEQVPAPRATGGAPA